MIYSVIWLKQGCLESCFQHDTIDDGIIKDFVPVNTQILEVWKTVVKFHAY